MARPLALSELSLRQRLLLLTLFICGICLLLGCAAFLLYDRHTMRDASVDELQSAAEMIGANSAAALAFDDPQGGEQVLQGLHALRHIRAGVLYNSDGKVFASYVRPDLAESYGLPKQLVDGVEWPPGKLRVMSPVTLEDRRLGTLVLESDLWVLERRTSQFAEVTVLIAGAMFLLVYFLTAVLQRSITGPIGELALVVRTIATEKRYDLRAPLLEGRELQQLGADFNYMLKEIEHRDAALVEARDSLEQRVAERTREVAESEERFRTLSELAPVGIALIDNHGKFSYVNKYYLEMTEMTADEALHDGWRRAIHPEDLERIEKSRNQAIRCGENYSMSYRHLTRDKRTVWVDTAARAFTGKDGVRNGYVVVIQDVTERHIASEKLREAKEVAEAGNRAKSEFLANMSHEIRTPMNGIIGMTELALDTELSSEQREYLGMVRSSAESLLGIINDILDFSKIEAGKMDIENAPFSLFDCIESALQPLALRAREKGLELTWTVDPQIPEWLLGDATRIRQILINLAGNAVKFTREGEVSVRAERIPGDEVGCKFRFVVSDTGIGIAAEKYTKVFEPFSQADGSTTREFGGTGLGLSISNRLVKLLGGEIWLESFPGKGTQFYFTVPLVEATSPETTPAAGDIAVLLNKSVLVVDDHEVNRQLLALLLPQWGLHVELAEDGYEALRKFEGRLKQEDPFPLVLLDNNMPQMSGIETAERIRRADGGSSTAILLLTSSPRPQDAALSQNLGIACTLNKPIQRSELRQAMTTALSGASQRRPHETPATPAASRPLRLLLVEDNTVNQKLVIHLLEKMGHRVTLAANGKEAVEELSLHSYDLILMDIQMPVMGGVEATRKIREMEAGTGKRTPILAMTAHAIKGDKEKYLAAGMDGYLSKPLRVELLCAEVDRLGSHVFVAPDKGSHGKNYDQTAARLNLQDLLGRVENDRELLRDLVDIFRRDLPRYWNTLELAVQAGDSQRVAQTAHTLKGTLANLSAPRAAASAAHLESLSRDPRAAEFTAALAALKEEVSGLLPELDAAVTEEKH